MNYDFPLLTADDIEVRIGTRKEGKGVTLLLYKDARVDMRLLDEIVGWDNWQREHKEIKGVVYCGVSIWDSEKGQWITKWDAGAESQTEKEKGEASDSFKRACFNFGIGRELYTAPFIWVNNDDKYARYSVSHIAYNNKRQISELIIVDEQNKEVYTFGVKKSREMPQNEKIAEPKPTLKTEKGSIRVDQYDKISATINSLASNDLRVRFLEQLEKDYQTSQVDHLSEQQAQNLLDRIARKSGNK